MASEQTDKPVMDKSFAFLIACLKHSSTGKTDWEALVEEEEIVTVNAAKKRWKRLMDAHGLSESSLTACSPKKGGRGGAKAKVSRAKKRKVESEEEEEETEEKEQEKEKEKEKEKQKQKQKQKQKEKEKEEKEKEKEKEEKELPPMGSDGESED